MEIDFDNNINECDISELSTLPDIDLREQFMYVGMFEDNGVKSVKYTLMARRVPLTDKQYHTISNLYSTEGLPRITDILSKVINSVNYEHNIHMLKCEVAHYTKMYEQEKYPTEYDYAAIIKHGKVIHICQYSNELDHTGDGVIKLDSETRRYVGGMPEVGYQFITTGNEYSVPPGTFISSNPQ